MKDWKKAVLWTLVGFCMISAVASVFSIISLIQMLTLDLTSRNINEEARQVYLGLTSAELVCAIACISFIVVTAVFFAKKREGDKKKLTFGFLIATVVISAALIVFAFFTLFVFKHKKFGVFGSWSNGSVSSTHFVYYQTYLSAMLSTFLPLLIAGGIILGYLIYGAKKQKSAEVAAETEEEA